MPLTYLDPSDVQDYRRDEKGPRYGRNVDGYGRKIPTDYWLRVRNRWRRVYVMIFSNSGTLYVIVNAEVWVVRDSTLTDLDARRAAD